MAAPIQILVDDPRFPSGRAALTDILAATFGTTAGQFPESTTKGWSTIALPHFAVRPLVGVVSTSGGGLLGFIPAEGNPIIVTRVTIYVVTKSNGAATLNIGVGTNTTTSANNLITACDVGANSGVVFNNISDIGASGSSRQLMTGVQAVTVTGTADTTGFVGILFVEFLKATNTGQ